MTRRAAPGVLRRRDWLAAAASLPLWGCHAPAEIAGGFSGTHPERGHLLRGKVSSVRNRSPGGNACGMRHGRRLAMTKPHSPKLGTCAWYGVAVSPAASMVATTVQKLWRATSGEVVCTTA